MAAMLTRIRFSSWMISRRTVCNSAHQYDVVIIGGGHNGLVAAGYLAIAGKNVAVFERRHILGGAAVTEEIVPNFKFSRASYVLGLLRPQIYKDLELKKYGLHAEVRNPNSFTPLHEKYWTDENKRSLILGGGQQSNENEISKFSVKDAQNFIAYERFLRQFTEQLAPLLDEPPPDFKGQTNNSLINRILQASKLLRTGARIGRSFPDLYKLVTAATSKILNEWFESEPLKATLATDSVIGSFISPSTPGSGYVLLHHLIGELNGVKEAWGFPIGGMGSVTQAMAASAKANGAQLYTDCIVEEILSDNGKVEGIRLSDGTCVKSQVVLSNATAHVTYLNLLPTGSLPDDFVKEIENINYDSPVCKINVALNALPNFKAIPNGKRCLPHHQTTIHLNCESMSFLDEAYLQGIQGEIPDKPMIEMTIPSSVDKTLAPKGCHVALFFTQYVPYTLKNGTWDDETKKSYAEKIFNIVDEYAPGFKSSVLGYECLPPPDLEKIFGLTGGNIFHGSMSLDQLYMCRPSASYPSPGTPIKGLYLCGSGAHPGGGVMGSCGVLAAKAVLKLKN